MQELDADSFDSIITDPPYGLSFMGKEWDHGVPGVPFWEAALRVAKPGAFLLAFGGTRTFHRLAVAIEDAGWEIRDTIMWVYGSGFPKSHDVSKAIDKAAGAEREVVGRKADYQKFNAPNYGTSTVNIAGRSSREVAGMITAPAIDAARQWSGWGTALKPAWEPILIARKPLAGTVAENILKYGTGALNIDASRIPFGDGPTGVWGATQNAASSFVLHTGTPTTQHANGRWPANLIHDGSDEVTELFPTVTSWGGPQYTRPPEPSSRYSQTSTVKNAPQPSAPTTAYPGTGSAARFFYSAKASKSDRDEGNTHPTVKPTNLMRYLCRLITQPNGLILDPFMGSGSTGKAAILEHYQFTGIDLNPEYIQIAHARITHALNTTPLFNHPNTN